MINLDRAASIAKDFLERTCGYLSYELQEISLKNDRWVVSYKPGEVFIKYLSVSNLYTVEVVKKRVGVLSFKRGS